MSRSPADAVRLQSPADRASLNHEGAGTWERLKQSREAISRELSKTIIGQEEVIEQLLLSLWAGGHCLITGAPGLAKTLLVKSIASVFHLFFQRIQFTPDLMPSDITGTEILQTDLNGHRANTFVRGPIFAQVLLADEINRTPPKTQAALLEAMQGQQVTAAGARHELDQPFFVLATQNPIEMEGTYPLPEAQLDRFLFNIVVNYLPQDEEVAVILRTTAGRAAPIEPVMTSEEVLELQGLVRQVPVAKDVAAYAVRLVAASRPKQPGTPDFVNEYVTWGAGLRAAQSLILAGKARALWQGRTCVSFDDVRAHALPALRHRVLLNYRAEAAGISSDELIRRLVEHVPVSQE